MEALLLTLDIGNSRAKAALWEGAARGPHKSSIISCDMGTDEFGGALGALLDSWLGELGRRAGAAVCTVGQTGLASGARAVLEGHGLGPVLVPPDHGLENSCRAAQTVGLDRLFAARGAVELTSGAALVVDAGTAVTVDAVGESELAAGVFLGGAIAPGPDLLAGCLESGTARLPRGEPRPAAHALGQDTGEALAAGVSVGFAGAVRALAEAVAAEAGLAGAPVVLTGGAACFLERAGLFGDRRVVYDEHLVGRGLRAAMALAKGAEL
ncbi:MAG: hypothetical protein CMK00_06155 [Planctomycetes bacterium]|nr:hypothetical protein [Planctomycetota bacterium]